MEAAAQLIVHPARRHLAQREQRHPERGLALLRVGRRAMVDMEEKIQRHRARKFRRAAEAAFARIVAARDLLIGGIDQLSRPLLSVPCGAAAAE